MGRDTAATVLSRSLTSRPSRVDLVAGGIMRSPGSSDVQVLELNTEISALRGKLEQQQVNHTQELQEMSDLHGKQVREASSDTAVTSYKLHQQRDDYTRQLTTMEEDIRRRVEIEFRQKKGPLYAKVSWVKHTGGGLGKTLLGNGQQTADTPHSSLTGTRHPLTTTTTTPSSRQHVY